MKTWHSKFFDQIFNIRYKAMIFFFCIKTTKQLDIRRDMKIFSTVGCCIDKHQKSRVAIKIRFTRWSKENTYVLTLSQTSPGFYVSAGQVLWKQCGKRRNCSWRAISPFPTVFSTRLGNFLSFSSSLKLSSANSLRLEGSKICRLGKG